MADKQLRRKLRRATRYWAFVAFLIVVEYLTISKPLARREATRRGIGIVTVMGPIFLGFIFGWEDVDFFTWLTSFTGFLVAGGTVLTLNALDLALRSAKLRQSINEFSSVKGVKGGGGY